MAGDPGLRSTCNPKFAAAHALVTKGLALTGVLSTAFFSAPSVSAAPAAAYRLANGSTSIRLEAGNSAPRLLSLGRGGGGEWFNETADNLPDHLITDQGERPIRWRLNAAQSRADTTEVALVYDADAPCLRLTWWWRAPSARGPLEHGTRILNCGAESLWLPLQPSLRFRWRVEAAQSLQRFWVEKGADTPSAVGTHRDEFVDGDRWIGTSSPYAHPVQGAQREMIPFVLVERARGDRPQGDGWYLGLEFSGRVRITLDRAANALSGEAGLNADAATYRTRLLPGANFETPTVFMGTFRGDVDDAGNDLRYWVRAVLGNSSTQRDSRYPLLTNNSWGSGMAVDETLARRMIADSRALGLEMFDLDAGWFRAVGDWRADPVKFSHGLAALADFAHGQGLKFGMWVDWAQAGVSKAPGALNVYDPRVRDWLVAEPPSDWKHSEPFKGVTIDLGVPAAHDWAAAELERLVSENHLDLLEHDGYLVAQGSAREHFPSAPPDAGSVRQYEDAGFQWADSSNSTDVSDHATRAYYDLMQGLRKRHSNLLLEICNDGGRMVDFGSAAHGDYFSITDTYDPLSNRRAFFDASHVLPPAMLETYVEQWPTPTLDAFRYMLRSGLMGWFTLMTDSSQWTHEQHLAARAEFDLYKRELRPLIRDADLYHVSERPDGVHWDGIEYFSPSRARGVLYAFRGSGEGASRRFRLRGLDPRQRYRIRFQDRGKSGDDIVRGEELLRLGVNVRLAEPLSSEMVFFSAIRPGRSAP